MLIGKDLGALISSVFIPIGMAPYLGWLSLGILIVYIVIMFTTIYLLVSKKTKSLKSQGVFLGFSEKEKGQLGSLFALAYHHFYCCSICCNERIKNIKVI